MGHVRLPAAGWPDALANPAPSLDRARRLQDETDSIHVREMTEFILAASDRSFLTPK